MFTLYSKQLIFNSDWLISYQKAHESMKQKMSTKIWYLRRFKANVMNTSSDFLIFDFLPGELVKCLFDFVNSSSISQFPFSFLIGVLAYFLPWEVLTCIPLAVSVLNLSPQYLHLKLCDSWVPSSKSIQVIFYEIDVLFIPLFLQLNQNVTTWFTLLF